MLIGYIRRRGFSGLLRNAAALHQDRDSPHWCCSFDKRCSDLPLLAEASLFTHVLSHIPSVNHGSCNSEGTLLRAPHEYSPIRSMLFQCSSMSMPYFNCSPIRCMSSSPIEMRVDKDGVRFCIGEQTKRAGGSKQGKKIPRRMKVSKKSKLNELRFYRLKAKKKMRSPNPEVRIDYRLGKAKRKEEWLIEKLRKFEIRKAPAEPHDPEILTEEEKFYLKRTGEKKKNYVPVGRRGVFGGVVLNMHLHWKRHETVKVVCKPCKPGQVHLYAEELARLSKGIVIDIKPNNTIIFYRGKNYVQPDVMSPPDTLPKAKALEKYKYEQSLEHTSQYIEKLEKELEEYHNHKARYRKENEYSQQDLVANA